MIDVEEAHQFIVVETPLMEAVELPLTEAVGLVLARDIEASEDIPPFNSSAMDGFALRASDTANATADQPVSLRIVDHIRAGQWPSKSIGPGEAMGITTGSPIPRN